MACFTINEAYQQIARVPHPYIYSRNETRWSCTQLARLESESLVKAIRAQKVGWSAEVPARMARLAQTVNEATAMNAIGSWGFVEASVTCHSRRRSGTWYPAVSLNLCVGGLSRKSTFGCVILPMTAETCDGCIKDRVLMSIANGCGSALLGKEIPSCSWSYLKRSYG